MYIRRPFALSQLSRRHFLLQIHCQIHHIAIVGSGPSGFYTAKYLLDRDSNIRIDLYEKLPVSYGKSTYFIMCYIF